MSAKQCFKEAVAWSGGLVSQGFWGSYCVQRKCLAVEPSLAILRALIDWKQVTSGSFCLSWVYVTLGWWYVEERTGKNTWIVWNPLQSNYHGMVNTLSILGMEGGSY